MFAHSARRSHVFRLSRCALMALASIALCACGGGDTTSGSGNNSGGGQQPADAANPTVSIASPSASGSYTSLSTIVTISGTAADDIGVTSVTWTNDRGGGSTASGTSAWSAANIALQAGANVITVTARDAAAKTATATITVTYNTGSTGTGQNWYVDRSHPDASDTAPDAGTAEDRPFHTLTAGLAAAMPGDTVIVKAGEYTDPNATWYSAFTPARSGTADAPITIKSDPPLAAVLVPRGFSQTPPTVPNNNPEYPAMAIFSRTHIIVDGFMAKGQLKIQHGGVDPQQGIFNLPQYVTIQNCEVLYGGKEGTDASLNYGVVIHSSNYNTLRNTRVHSLRSSGNHSNNTAAIMLFAAAHNVIENNDADAGHGTVYSAYGQKAGQIHDNIWRRNIARNAIVGFLGKGGTSGSSYADNETYYENLIINSQIAFNLNHNSRYWRVYNNTAYNVDFFLNQWQLNSVDNQFWNNIVVLAPQSQPPPQPEPPPQTRPQAVYRIEDGTSDWNTYISYSNHNFTGSAGAIFARSAQTYDLAEWRSLVGHDQESLFGNAGFEDLISFRLQPDSPAKGAGRYGEDMGAYPNSAGTIGVSWGP
jgi:nitrogen regulatory protein PII